MLEKQVVIDKIEVLEDGQIQVREVTRIKENGKLLGQTYRRWVVTPEDDISNQDKKVKDIAGIVHTEAVKSAYRAKIANDNQHQK